MRDRRARSWTSSTTGDVNSRRSRHARLCVAGAVLLLVGNTAAMAQLAPADITSLRERGQREGWTFTVGETVATRQPLDQLCGLIEPDGWEATVQWLPPVTETDTLPATFDWRDPPPGYPLGVTPIRNQMECGSCWAFGAIGALECSLMVELGLEADLSEQWLVSCTGAGTCAGGWHDDALDYMRCRGDTDPCGDFGAVPEAEFPYEAADAPCTCPHAHPYCLYNYYGVPNQVTAIKNAIMTYGPVTTTVYVDDAFSAYTGGIFNACNYFQVNHAVVLVGWDDNEGAWIMRNSWGPQWGENGYMRIAYGCSQIGHATFAVQYLPPDCNSNGIADDFDIADGTSLDCNDNGTPDECEIAADEVADCNTNGLIDTCEVAEGTTPDCNGNGVPDDCDLARGVAFDCNSNGILDACDLAPTYQARSSRLAPLTHDVVLEFALPEPRLAEQDVALTVTASGDLNYNSEHVVVLLDGVEVGRLFRGVAADCAEIVDELSIPASTFNTAAADGTAIIGLAPTAAVNALTCADNWANVSVTYAGIATAYDCNTNGIPDACDIAAGFSPDHNKDGVPDECAGLDIGDCNCDGQVNWRDIDYFVAGINDNRAGWLAMFAPNTPACSYDNLDVSGDGHVNWRDIGPFTNVVQGRQ